jgi:NADH-quinone oxidoreductase subunit E
MDKQLSSIFQLYPNRQRDDLIPILHKIQDQFGFLSEELIIKVGEYLDISVNKIFGVATFYDNFRFGPKGRYHIRLCHGTACHVAGAANIITELEKLLRIKNGETDKNGMFSLEVVSCMGACGLAPLIEINDEYFTFLSVESMREIIAQYRENHNNVYENS